MTDQRPVELASLALACHELRAPLGMIATAARILASDCSDRATVQQMCDRIERSAQRLIRTSRSVIVASLGEPVADGRCFAATALRRSLEDAEAFGLQVKAELPPADLLVTCQLDTLESLVTSLLLNASDHADLAHPIAVRCEWDASHLRITMVNRSATEVRHQGFGLGALVVDALVRITGGHISSNEVDGWYTTDLILGVASLGEEGSADGEGIEGPGRAGSSVGNCVSPNGATPVPGVVNSESMGGAGKRDGSAGVARSRNHLDTSRLGLYNVISS